MRKNVVKRMFLLINVGLEQQNKEKDKAIELLKAQMEIIVEKVGGEVHNHNTTNYTVNTVNIMLNAFGSETTDYLTESKVKEILQQGGQRIVYLVY